MAEATITTTGQGRYQISGEMVFASVVALRNASLALFEGEAGPLDIDLAPVVRADSAGMALLIEWMRLAAAKGHQIRYHHLPLQLQAIAEVCDLVAILPLNSASTDDREGDRPLS
jgi:phospholipid transport system transporter-binding protein